ncbi:hypothetical protein KY317_01860 [Candidatus Woesearchaeota archaeon]|nr:hypothetical protein [Candidatus Woesearchaeota archaeon]
MRKLILIAGILAMLFVVGCAVEQAEETAEIQEPIREPVEEVVEEPAAPEEPAVIPEPVEEAPKSTEFVELEIEIKHETTDSSLKEEGRLDKITVNVKNIKYDPTLKHPLKDLRVKVYTTKDKEDSERMWMDDLIDHEKIRYGMVATKYESIGGYNYKEEVVIKAEVYDSEDILLASASKTVAKE